MVKIHPHLRLCVQQRRWARASALLSPRLLKQSEELVLTSQLCVWLPAHTRLGKPWICSCVASDSMSKASVLMHVDGITWAHPLALPSLPCLCCHEPWSEGGKGAAAQRREHFSAGNPSWMQVAQLFSFTSAPLRGWRECAQDLRGWC